jgi:hypothetical protein
LTNRELPPHPNVVQMFGVSLDGPQPIIVLEYCTGGILIAKSQVYHNSSFDCKENLSISLLTYSNTFQIFLID